MSPDTADFNCLVGSMPTVVVVGRHCPVAEHVLFDVQIPSGQPALQGNILPFSLFERKIDDLVGCFDNSRQDAIQNVLQNECRLPNGQAQVDLGQGSGGIGESW